MHRAVPPFASLLFLAGCAGELSPSAGEGVDAAGERTTALVIIERSASASDVSTGSANARFVRYPSFVSADDALRRIGATVDLPALGTCAPISSLRPTPLPETVPGTAALSSAAPLQLLDVGAVTLAVNGAQTELLARHLPDVTDLVYGVVYSRVTVPEAPAAKAEYRIDLGTLNAPNAMRAVPAASGGAERFAATAPDEIQGLRVGDAVVLPGEAVPLSAGSPFTLHWTAGGAGDIVYVDVRPAAAATSTSAFARCAFPDTGSGLVPARTISFDDGSVTVHRLHEEAVSTSAFDTGEILFDFARTFSVVHP